jgi:hypothetical protein
MGSFPGLSSLTGTVLFLDTVTNDFDINSPSLFKYLSLPQNPCCRWNILAGWKPQWPWLGTGISKEMVGWIRF